MWSLNLSQLQVHLYAVVEVSTSLVNSSSYKHTWIGVTEMLLSAWAKPERKVHLYQR